MLRFVSGLELHLLHMEIALVLHHASVWAAVHSTAVDVVARGGHALSPGTLRAWSLAVDLNTDADRFDLTEQLFGYLARILPGAYHVQLEQNHVHVEYDPRRRPPRLDPTFAPGGQA